MSLVEYSSSSSGSSSEDLRDVDTQKYAIEAKLPEPCSRKRIFRLVCDSEEEEKITYVPPKSLELEDQICSLLPAPKHAAKVFGPEDTSAGKAFTGQLTSSLNDRKGHLEDSKALESTPLFSFEGKGSVRKTSLHSVEQGPSCAPAIGAYDITLLHGEDQTIEKCETHGVFAQNVENFRQIRQEDQLGPRRFVDEAEASQAKETRGPNSGQSKFRPSMVHKVKHQITYLAYQAQQMQDELKERSAQSRRAKRETYSKYGF